MIRRMWMVGLLGTSIAMGQAPATPATAGAAVATRPLAFDVVSVRQNTSEPQRQMGMPVFGPTPNGYRMTNMPLILPILTAFVPGSRGVQMSRLA